MQQNEYCPMHFPEKITSICGSAVTCRPLPIWVSQSRWRTQANICESIDFFFLFTSARGAAVALQRALGPFQMHSPLIPFLWPKLWSFHIDKDQVKEQLCYVLDHSPETSSLPHSWLSWTAFNEDLPISLGPSSRIGYWPYLQHKGRKKCPYENRVSLLSAPSVLKERAPEPSMCIWWGMPTQGAVWHDRNHGRNKVQSNQPLESGHGQRTHTLVGLIVFRAC